MTKVSIALWLLFIVCSLNARFTSVDPAREFSNPYSYTANNPIIYIDPDGRAKVVGGTPEQKTALETAIKQVPGPLGDFIDKFDVKVKPTVGPVNSNHLGRTTWERSVLKYVKMTPKERAKALKKKDSPEIGSAILVTIHPSLLVPGKEEALIVTVLHEASHAQDYLDSLVKFLDGKKGDVDKYYSEVKAYTEGNEFITGYLGYSLYSKQGLEAGAVPDVTKHLQRKGVVEGPSHVIGDELHHAK